MILKKKKYLRDLYAVQRNEKNLIFFIFNINMTTEIKKKTTYSNKYIKIIQTFADKMKLDFEDVKNILRFITGNHKLM